MARHKRKPAQNADSCKAKIIFRSDPSLNRERFAIIDAATEKTIDQG